jgi:hypothetical protein
MERKTMRGRWKAGLLVLVTVGVAACLAGCSQQDGLKAATTIHAYLPTVMGLASDATAVAGTLDPAEAANLQVLGAKVQTELQELEDVSGAYVAAPTGDGWTKLGSVVDELVSDADQGLLAALAIKDPASQAKAKVALSALDAAMHVVDGYLLSARTPAEVNAAAATRAVKLQSVVRYWNPRDWQRVEQAFGGRGEELQGAEMRLGF